MACSDTEPLDPPAIDTQTEGQTIAPNASLEQLWIRADGERGESALREAGFEIVGKRGPATYVALASPSKALPAGFEAHKPAPDEKLGAVLRARMSADPEATHRAEVLVLVEAETEAREMVSKHGVVPAEGGLRYGGAMWVTGGAEALRALAAEATVRAVLRRLDEPVSMAPDGDHLPVPMNASSRETSRVDQLHPGGTTGFDLTGRGITLGLIDNGRIRESHRDFGGRVSYRDGGDEFAGHATHVSGTMIGAGVVRAEGRGMAYEARLIGFSFFGDAVGKMAANGHTFTASNHSYGQNLGWANNNGQWRWNGDTGFGKYDQGARRSDDVVYNSDAIWLKAAGNDRNDRPDQADENRPGDCSRGYDCIATGSVSKNLIIVAAVHDLPGGPDNVADVRPTVFSGYGPADDGRIKPDLAANGQELLSTGPNNDEHYTVLSGTSMATPSITGIAGLLLEQYAAGRNGATPTVAEIKGVLIHTARSPFGEGRPDHRLGFGLVDAQAAAELVDASLDNGGLITNDTLPQGARAYTVEAVPGEDIVLTLVWTDPPGEVNTAGKDDRTPALVNDLDMTVTPPGEDALPNYPWRLQPDRPGERALSDGPNRRDNVEKIFVPGDQITEAGTWRVELRLDTEPFQGRPQAYSLISSHILSPEEGELPVDLEVGRVVRLRLLESAEPEQVVLPLASRDGRDVGYALDIDELPVWLTLDRSEGTLPGEPATATIDPSGLSNALYFAAFSARNTSNPEAPAKRLTIELEVTESQIPRAVAGADRTVPSGAHVQLVGSGSDPGGDPLAFTWTQTDGPEADIEDLSVSRIVFDAPVVEGEEPATLVFELVVANGDFVSQPDTVQVIVLPAGDGPGEPANNRCETAEIVGLPHTAPGDLEFQHDVDFVAIEVEASERVEVETFQRGDGIDTTLGIVTLEGEVLQSNDDGGQGLYSRLTFTAETSGTYCVAVSTFTDFAFDGAAARTGGGYGLSIIGAGFNTAPVAHAGGDQRVPSGRIVRLDGRQSTDAQRDALSFAWTQVEGPNVGILDSNQALAIFLAPDVDDDTELRFELRVSDGSLEDTAEAVVTVEPGFVIGAQPYAGPDRVVAEGARIQLDAEASNPDEVSLGWRWTQISGPSAPLRFIDRPSTEFTAPLVDEPTDLTFSVRVLEGEFFSIDDEVTIRVVPIEGEGEPENNNCKTAPFVDDLVYEEEGRLDAAHDVDYVRMFIVDGMTFSIETQPVGDAFTDTTVGLARLREGDVWDLRQANDDGGLFVMSRLGGFFGGDGTICIAVSGHGDIQYFDGSFHTVEGDYQLRIVMGPPQGNQPPSVVVPAQLRAEPGTVVEIDGSESSDPDGDPITFEWTQIAGPELALEDTENPVLSVALPAELDQEAHFRFSLRVSDRFASNEGSTDVIVRANNAPLLGPVEAITATEGDLVAIQLEGSDPDEDEIFYGGEDLPEGSTIDRDTGAFAWQTALGDAGAYTLALFAEDSFGAQAFQRVDLVVEPGENLPPVVTPIEPWLVNAEGDETPITLSATATDPEMQALTFAWAPTDDPESPIGEGAEIEVLLAPGRHSFTVSVSDGVNVAQAEARVMVLGDDQRPVAVVGGAQRVAMPPDAATAAAYIDGRESFDPLGRDLEFVWELSETAAESFEISKHLDVFSIGVLRVLAPGDEELPATVRLTVVAQDEDFGDIASRPSETTVRVVPEGNRLPTATILGPDRAAQGDTIEVDGSESFDPDGEPLRYAWALTRGTGDVVAPTEVKTGIFLEEPRDPTPIGWTLVLMVNDGLANSAPNVLTIRRAASTPMPDVGTPDAGMPDAGNEDEAPVISTSPPSGDCGCVSVARPDKRSPSGLALVLLVLVGVLITRRGAGVRRG